MEDLEKTWLQVEKEKYEKYKSSNTEQALKEITVKSSKQDKAISKMMQ